MIALSSLQKITNCDDDLLLSGGVICCHVQQPTGKFFAKIFLSNGPKRPIFKARYLPSPDGYGVFKSSIATLQICYLLNPNFLMIS